MFAIRARSAGLSASRFFRASLVPFAIFTMGAACRAGVSYTLTDLGTLPGWPSAIPAAINDAGQVTGNDFSSMPYQNAFLYSGGTLTDLGNLGRVASVGLAINNAGQVVGFTGTQGSDEHAFLYSNGTMVDLTPSSTARSSANGINDKGQVVGYFTNGSSPIQAALFSGGTIQSLGALTPGGSSEANAINQSGEIVGNSTYPGGVDVTHAFVYANGVMKDLGTFGGQYSDSNAAAVNSSGQVVGYAQTLTGSDPFLYSNGTMYDLGNLPGPKEEGGATGINDAGTIVGSSRNDITQLVSAFVYTDGTMYDLNSLLVNSQGYHLTQATGINNSGQIVSWATTDSGAYRAVLLTPTAVPVPPAAWAALTALPLVLLSMPLNRRRAWISRHN